MSRKILSAVTLIATTGLNGQAAFSLRVPGTFSGVTTLSSGRFLKKAVVFADTPENGDRIFGLRVSDDDGILAALGKTAAFPNYPTIYSFDDPGVTEVPGQVVLGLAVPSAGLEIAPVDDSEEYHFIPSGFYIKGNVEAGGLLQSASFRIDLFWGRQV